MTQQPQNSPLSPPVEDLVKKNDQAVADIQESAEELEVVHAVLRTELKNVLPSEDAELAIERTKQVKEQLEETAAELKEATDALKAQQRAK